MLLTAPLYDAMLEVITQIFLLKEALQFVSYKRLRLRLGNYDFIESLLKSSADCEITMEAFTEIVNSLPFQFV